MNTPTFYPVIYVGQGLKQWKGSKGLTLIPCQRMGFPIKEMDVIKGSLIFSLADHTKLQVGLGEFFLTEFPSVGLLEVAGLLEDKAERTGLRFNI